MSDTRPNTRSVTSNVIQFPDANVTSIGHEAVASAPPSGVVTWDTEGSAVRKQFIDIDRLYEGIPGSVSVTVRAIEQLKPVCDNLDRARKMNDPIEADRFVQRVQMALPKLFAERFVGDGFGVIINSLHFAFANLHGKPLTIEQVNAVYLVLAELRKRPVMTLEQGIQRVEQLEACGLEVDPSGLGELVEASGTDADE